jgi:hypothetical protein
MVSVLVFFGLTSDSTPGKSEREIWKFMTLLESCCVTIQCCDLSLASSLYACTTDRANKRPVGRCWLCINHRPIFTGGSIGALADTSHQIIVLSPFTELCERALNSSVGMMIWLQTEGRGPVVRFSAGLNNLSLLQNIQTSSDTLSASYPTGLKQDGAWSSPVRSN